MQFRTCSRLCFCLIFLVASPALLGCDMAGSTTRQTVDLVDFKFEQALVPIRVESVSSAPDAAVLISAGVFEWGKFDASDLANLRGSLEDTIEAAARNVRVGGLEKLSISMMVRRYVVAASNVEGAALVAIDWCISRSDGLPVYRELFYAAKRGRFIGTLGMIKDSVQRAIVRRVSESSLALAGQSRSATGLPRTVAGTFDNIDEALTTLPESVRSWGAPFFISKSPLLFGYIPGSMPQAVPWRSAKMTASISCGRLLKEGMW